VSNTCPANAIYVVGSSCITALGSDLCHLSARGDVVHIGEVGLLVLRWTRGLFSCTAEDPHQQWHVHEATDRSHNEAIDRSCYRADPKLAVIHTSIVLTCVLTTELLATCHFFFQERKDVEQWRQRRKQVLHMQPADNNDQQSVRESLICWTTICRVWTMKNVYQRRT